MSENPYQIFAVSDATGEMAMDIAFAALRQFKVDNVNILRRSNIREIAQMTEVVAEAKKKRAAILFTLVSQERRLQFSEECHKQQVIAVDLMGPVLDVLATYFSSSPSSEPGLQYRQTSEYFRRQEAIEFTVKHDDGMGVDTMNQADIVLVGISRTSKTPLSVYLAFRGYKVANVPLVRNIALPAELEEIDRSKMVGLSIDVEKLVQLRETRLIKLGRPLSEEYASSERVQEEIQFAIKIFEQLGSIPVINVTDKAIEEIATEVLATLGK